MKIVLFGSTGMLGRYIYMVLKDNYEIHSISRDNYDIENDSWKKLEDILNKSLQKNDVIINCAGIIPQKYKVDNYRTYIRVNTLFPHKLNELSKKNSYKFIHVTTDCVYDGSKGNYNINDEHTAKNIYGITKSQGEPEDATIIRTSIIGEELTGKKSLIEWVKSNKDGKIKGFTNHYWNGVTCFELAKYIKNILDSNTFWNGIKHICSPNIVTKYELCCYINEIYNLNINIENYEDSISKNMTLISYEQYDFNDVYKQILDLSQFNLHP
jgi:dTDP-4-dehydrorhamnose reductase